MKNLVVVSTLALLCGNFANAEIFPGQSTVFLPQGICSATAEKSLNSASGFFAQQNRLADAWVELNTIVGEEPFCISAHAAKLWIWGFIHSSVWDTDNGDPLLVVDEFLSQASDDTWLLIQRASLHERRGEIGRAMADLVAATDGNMFPAHARVNLIDLAWQLGNYDLVRVEVSKLRDETRANASYPSEVEMLLQEARTADARRLVEFLTTELVSINNARQLAGAYLVDLAVLDGEYDKALEILNELTSANPRKHNFWLKIHEIHLELGNTEPALNALEQAILIDDQDNVWDIHERVDALNKKAELLAETGRIDEAVAVTRRVFTVATPEMLMNFQLSMNQQFGADLLVNGQYQEEMLELIRQCIEKVICD